MRICAFLDLHLTSVLVHFATARSSAALAPRLPRLRAHRLALLPPPPPVTHRRALTRVFLYDISFLFAAPPPPRALRRRNLRRPLRRPLRRRGRAALPRRRLPRRRARAAVRPACRPRRRILLRRRSVVIILLHRRVCVVIRFDRRCRLRESNNMFGGASQIVRRICTKCNGSLGSQRTLRALDALTFFFFFARCAAAGGGASAAS